MMKPETFMMVWVVYIFICGCITVVQGARHTEVPKTMGISQVLAGLLAIVAAFVVILL